MNTSDFDYNLPLELIAQKPVEPRDYSRLFVVDRKEIGKDPSAKFTPMNIGAQDKHFYDIIDYLKPGDLIVWNNSKVFKARLFGELESTNNQELFEHKKKIEVFLVREMENKGVWKVLAKPGRHVRVGMRIRFSEDFYCDAMIKDPEGTILVQFPYDAETVMKKANKYGHIPVPPYVKDEPDQIETYQTVYAKDEGSVAAPTAGFHFTKELIEKIKAKGVEFAEVTLHVGLGTFLPVKSERVEDHTMHSEWIELSQENADKINKAKAEGRRVVAVGTTTVRTLEGVAQKFLPLPGGVRGGLQPEGPHPTSPYRGGAVHAYKGDINIFITPGFEFKVVDAMITNFHLPKSTLLMLVSAFIGDREKTLEIYNQAVAEKYRFFSFGDAMFIH
ncbi:MAG: tRNA preQ1(34) S-adenosylmethionine ribosyltransferase-isomerase QueA [Candidatus Magasanikiibacteriota bacterium]